jgi:hypothetical protein
VYFSTRKALKTKMKLVVEAVRMTMKKKRKRVNSTQP